MANSLHNLLYRNHLINLISIVRKPTLLQINVIRNYQLFVNLSVSNAYSPYCSLYIFEGVDKENIFNSQEFP